MGLWSYTKRSIVRFDDGWVINLLEGSTMINDLKVYRIKHAHEGYDWNVDAVYAGAPLLGRCIRCRTKVPEKLLGFLELLRWDV